MKLTKFWLMVPVLIIIAGLMFTGCEEISLIEDLEDDGELALFIADKPVNNVAEVWVTIERVEASIDGEGWVVINDFEDQGGEMEFDLMTLRFNEELLGQEYLQEGLYSQIRLIVAAEKEDQAGNNNPTQPNPSGKSRVVYQDDEKEDDDIFIPSGVQTGLKLNHEFTIEEGTLTKLLLDVSIEELLHSAGRSGKIILRPTAIRVIDKIVSGDIEGKVLLENEEGASPITDKDVMIEALDDDGEVIVDTVALSSDSSEENRDAGEFMLRGLEKGSYDLKIYVAAEDEEGDIIIDEEDNPVVDEDYTTAYIENIEVNAEETTILDEDIILEEINDENENGEEDEDSDDGDGNGDDDNDDTGDNN